MRSKSQYSFVQYSISKSDAQKWNVLRSRSASFERTMPCPLTIPKTNKKTFHVISRKKIQIHLSHRGAHAKPIPGWKVRQMSLEHTHTKSRSDWLNFCNNSIRIYILSWGGRFQPIQLSYFTSERLCDILWQPQCPKNWDFPVGRTSQKCNTSYITKSIPFRASIVTGGFQ